MNRQSSYVIVSSSERRRSGVSITLHFFLLNLFLFLGAILPGQNLIPNAGFEKYAGKGIYITAAKPWKNINTVDYYHTPFKLRDDRKVEAHGGKSFIGLRFQHGYKEYIFVKLDSNLRAGHHYTLELWFCMGEWSTVALKSMGAVFSKKQMNQQQIEKTPREFITEVGNKKGIISDYKWTKLTLEYTAIGGERFITIGNMAPKLDRDYKRIQGGPFAPKEAYYFMDDLSLIENRVADTTRSTKIDSLIAVNQALPIDTFKTMSARDLKVGQIIKMHNIYFEPGTAELLEESHDELDYIVQFLNENPNVDIRINGHTDNSGYKLNNNNLSEQRAFAVYSYIMKKGVKNNVSYKGFGATRPVASNNTVVGRSRNRRVEIEILKK